MKGFPSGWKPPKGKKPRLPTPPTGSPHHTPKEYDRNDWRDEVREEIDEALKEHKRR